MRREVKIPLDDEQQGIVLEWKKNELDWVVKDEDLVEVETEKANITLPANGSGVLTVMKQKGEIVSGNDVLGYIETAE
jgi:2-oxoglutarate dehydrogenase E2 component (dihydrolipoamide succinyltransferase)